MIPRGREVVLAIDMEHHLEDLTAVEGGRDRTETRCSLEVERSVVDVPNGFQPRRSTT